MLRDNSVHTSVLLFVAGSGIKDHLSQKGVFEILLNDLDGLFLLDEVMNLYLDKLLPKTDWSEVIF